MKKGWSNLSSHDTGKYLIYLLIAVVGISFAAFLVRIAAVEPMVSAQLRTAYGSIALLAIIPVMLGRSLSTIPFEQLKQRKIIGYMLAAGVFFGLDLYVWHESIDIIESGLATVVANTQVFHAALIGVIIYGERLPKSWWIVLPAAVIGIFLIGSHQAGFSTDPDFLIGVGLALLAGFLYAIFLAFTRAMRFHSSHIPAVITWTGVSIMSAISILVFNGFTMPVAIPIESHLILFLLGLITQGISWILIATAIPHVPLSTTAMMLLGQPVLATIWGNVFLNEQLTSEQWLGVCLTILAIGIAQFLRLKKI